MFRRYAPKQNRFAQPDPYDGSYNRYNPQSLNRYAYTQGDPVNFVDPSGLHIAGPNTYYGTWIQGQGIFNGGLSWFAEQFSRAIGGARGVVSSVSLVAGDVIDNSPISRTYYPFNPVLLPGGSNGGTSIDSIVQGVGSAIGNFASKIDKGQLVTCGLDISINEFISSSSALGNGKSLFELTGAELNIAQTIGGYESFSASAEFSDLASSIANLNAEGTRYVFERAGGQGGLNRAEQLLNRKKTRTARQVKKLTQGRNVTNLRRLSAIAKRSAYAAVIAKVFDLGLDIYECLKKSLKN
jgi:hypothetical protein